MGTPKPPLISDPALVTTEWLTALLRSGGALDDATVVTGFDTEAIGTGQIGANIRFRLQYSEDGAGPASIVGKFASSDEVSRQAGVMTLTYETEVAFYRDLADSVEISRPFCYLADIVSGTAEVALMLEDMAPAQQGDQITGCSVAHAELAMVEAARLHGPRWNDPTLRDIPWLAGTTGPVGAGPMLNVFWDGFVDRYKDTLSEEAVAVGQQLRANPPVVPDDPTTPITITHGDYRLDNMLFGTAEGGKPLAVVDWQTVRLGVGTADVSYFLGAGLEADVRREHEQALVGRYHETLLTYGVKDYSLDQCWADYRRYSYGGFIMAVIASMLVGRTDRGDAMFMAMANRHAVQVLDAT